MDKQVRLTLPMQFRKATRALDDGNTVEDMIVEGYAFKYNTETVLYETSRGFQYREVIEKGALEGADLSDVPFKYNHNDGVFIVARTRNGSLELIPDDVGLFIRARFIDTQTGRDFFKMIQERLIDKMSFAFTEGSEYEDSYGEDFIIHRVKSFKRIWDVSGVDIPAYDATEIYARSIAVLEKRRDKVLERAMQQKRKRMMLENKITEFLEENDNEH
jgi:HK97 family phage prohead protease